MENLKPCPFCGNDDLSVCIMDVKFTDSHIKCRKCGGKMQLCSEYGKDELIRRWNRRTTDADRD